MTHSAAAAALENKTSEEHFGSTDALSASQSAPLQQQEQAEARSFELLRVAAEADRLMAALGDYGGDSDSDWSCERAFAESKLLAEEESPEDPDCIVDCPAWEPETLRQRRRE